MTEVQLAMTAAHTNSGLEPAANQTNPVPAPSENGPGKRTHNAMATKTAAVAGAATPGHAYGPNEAAIVAAATHARAAFDNSRADSQTRIQEGVPPLHGQQGKERPDRTIRD